MARSPKLVVACIAACLVAAPAASAETTRYILPPGNFGGLPTTQNSLDQLPLYDGLTPLRGNVSAADVNRFYLPEDFKPIGTTRDEPTGRAGLRIVYDSYGVPHIYGDTRDDLSFGSGWVTARDRGLLLNLGRGPARVAVADVPGIDAFSLVTSGQGFAPSKQAEALVTKQKNLLVKDLRRQGARDPPGRAGLHRRRQRLPALQGRAGRLHGERRDRDHRVHRLDLRRRRRRRGAELPAAGRAAQAVRQQARHGRVQGRDAGRRPGGADDDRQDASSTGRRTGGKVKGSVVVDAGLAAFLRPAEGVQQLRQDRRAGGAGAAGGRRTS